MNSAAEMRAEAAERRIKAMSQPQSSKLAKEEPSESEDAYTDGDELEDDDQNEGEDADFGPNAVKKMFGTMDADERDAMTGGVSENDKQFEADDLGPCGSAAVCITSPSQAFSTLTGCPRSQPNIPKLEDDSIRDDQQTTTTNIPTITRPTQNLPSTSSNPIARLSSKDTKTFSTSTLIKEEKKRLRPHEPGRSLGEPPKDVRFWRCTQCGLESHQDYAHCPKEGCSGSNLSRKSFQAPSPIVISDDDD